MATYLIHFKANPVAWPNNPQDVLGVWEGAVAGADQQLQSGQLKDILCISVTEGYAVAECNSKAEAIGLATPFFPWFSHTITEMVPWNQAKEAVLAAARASANG